MPARSTAETWTKTSLPPPSGVMKPKPFVALKNLTVPVFEAMPAVPNASGFTLATYQGVVKSNAIVRKELEPIARTELFATAVKLGPHFTDVQPSLVPH